MKYKSVKGMKDILPSESAAWRAVEDAARAIFGLYGYDEIRTPVVEETALFVKSVGEETDIVRKEMFSFTDRGDRDISLRPEGTAPIIRAYIENNLDKTSQFQKLYYLGSMFRAERPQAGRLRQFNQIGAEAIGSNNPALDAEVMMVMAAILEAAGIKNYTIKINNLGCKIDKKKLSDNLREVFSGKEAKLLCDDCKSRLKANPLRVLDCKNDNCKALVRKAFKETDFLCEDCKRYFDKVRSFLDMAGVKYTLDPFIVRGLDYYTRTVFEVTSSSLGSQDAIGAGGRYDNLVSDMGGPVAGACGFALGMERMMIVLEKSGAAGKKTASAKEVFIASIGEAAYEKAFLLAVDLRSAGIACDMDYEGKSLKAQMRRADSLGVKFALIIGEDEIRSGAVILRNMGTKEQLSIKFGDIVAEIKRRINQGS